MSRMLRFASEADLNAMLARSGARKVQPMPAAAGELDHPKPNKFGAQPTEVDGIRFDSKKEAKRYQTLDAMQDLGKITKLRHHVPFDLVVEGLAVAIYESDFVYNDEAGKLVVEDVKGMKKGPAYDLFKLKSRLMRALYGADVREV